MNPTAILPPPRRYLVPPRCRGGARIGLRLAALALALAAPATTRADVSYTVTDLGTLGGTYSGATGINASGQVVGSSYTASGQLHAFLYDSTGMHDLGTLGGAGSGANGINASGQIVGSAQNASGSYHAFLYDGTGMHDLGTLGTGATTSSALGIDGSGRIVGVSDTAFDASEHAFLYNSTGMHDLGTLGGKDSVAYAINGAGQIVGDANTTGNSSLHAFLFNGTGKHDIDTLGNVESTALAINALGQVAGVFVNSSGGHAFLYDGTGMHDLGTLPAGSDSTARGINDAGQVVGDSFTVIAAGNKLHAFLYSGGSMVDLNSLIDPASGWTLTEADAINDAGQIVGHGTINGQTHAFLLKPTALPEPSSIALAALGLATVGLAGFRRHRSQCKAAQ
jgi:probable HAF family extracellular repeat protein